MIIKIGKKIIGKNYPVFIVAELGINHNGRVALAKKMMLAAKKAGADACKLQSFVTKDFVGDQKLKYTYISQGKKITESQYQMFKRYELSQKIQKELFNYAKKIGIILFSTPQDNDFKMVDFLCSKTINMPSIKVGSDDLTNLAMLTYYAKKKKPLIISTGMADLGEIKDAVEAIQKYNKKLAILKCTSLYPTPAREANLNQILTLKKMFPQLIIGYSDHTIGSLAAVMATALGAKMIEKHFTLNKNLPGPDHRFSADPKELSDLVKNVRAAELMLGKKEFILSAEELKMKKIARRSVIADRDIKKGQKIKTSDLVVKRPGTGLPPKYLSKIVGKIAKRNIESGKIINLKDF
ncbi:MAG: N-acetylneuraminate synthase [Candidatus Buchananbacteria bacterium RIFCSPHIGHO2_01_FULL_39_14]|uniref:N-acetylneuraminate synthase n=1 Tax=Candidatus Buchananbacteria bacterium RIFCSPHIGHO2_01_FULL_39_14 TaxID=1797532 RepID=A0A1G1Y059_9BACT|nr:MAG: N-acetylneuraminate synthase [Candidatus Buchananbacteria bacterium RIFCSPHIGHO2_01_FULL_39_14]OGY48662.1 MAG: N-acetylneuraminate synthase [Candidatus Buchananbacteria bacterium RIFCSPHIGHO2_02_FULL_39_17]